MNSARRRKDAFRVSSRRRKLIYSYAPEYKKGKKHNWFKYHPLSCNCSTCCKKCNKKDNYKYNLRKLYKARASDFDISVEIEDTYDEYFAIENELEDIHFQHLAFD